jgi:hypothetical protein
LEEAGAGAGIGSFFSTFASERITYTYSVESDTSL